MRTWVVIYWRTYDPGLVLTGTVLAHTIAGAVLKAASTFDISERQINAVIMQGE